MKFTDANGDEHELTCVDRDDWDSLSDPCPECGGQGFTHISTSGGRYGPQDETVVMRSDFWDVERPLFTRCRDCREVVYRHPAFDLLFEIDLDDGVAADSL